MTIFKPPRILTIHFLRFTYTGRKLGKHIQFPKSFNLRVFVSENVDGQLPKEQQTNHIYHLYGVIVHAGKGSKAGHYYSFVRKGEKWYCCNDESISEVKNIDQVMKQNAYMLVYRYKTPAPPKPAKKEEFGNLALSRTKSLTAEILETHQNKNSNITPLSGFFESKEEVNSEEEEEKLIQKEEVTKEQKEKFDKIDYIMANFEEFDMNDVKNLDIMRNLSVISSSDIMTTPELKSYISSTLSMKTKKVGNVQSNGNGKVHEVTITNTSENGIKVPNKAPRKRKRSENKNSEENGSEQKDLDPKDNKRDTKEISKKASEATTISSVPEAASEESTPSKAGKKSRKRNRKNRNKNRTQNSVEDKPASTTNRKFDNLVKKILSSK